jgi:hypothetical protein
MLVNNSTSLEEEYTAILSAEIAKEIDSEILFSLLCHSGWHTCEIDPRKHTSLDAVVQWCNQYAGEKAWAKTGNRFAFKDARVATMFRIHWS